MNEDARQFVTNLMDQYAKGCDLRLRDPVSHASESSRSLPTVPAAIVRRLIETRAQELYEQRCRQDGRAEEDWLRAESEILNGLPSSEAPEPVQHYPATGPAVPFASRTAVP
jgi:hypothetical protein